MKKQTGGKHNFANMEPEKLRELASRGGKACAAARKRKTGLREALIRLMDEQDVQERLAEALVREATDGARPGSAVKAFEVIQEMINERPGRMDAAERLNLSMLSTEELLELLEVK